MRVERKPALIAMLLGAALGLLPALFSHISSTSKQADLLFQWMGLLLLPGLPFALLLSGKNCKLHVTAAAAVRTLRTSQCQCRHEIAALQ